MRQVRLFQSLAVMVIVIIIIIIHSVAAFQGYLTTLVGGLWAE